MKLSAKMTLVFLTAQLVATVGIGVAVVLVVRGTVQEMVQEESTQMLAAISDTAELAAVGSGDRMPDSFREYVLNREIGETGFYFVLNFAGDYLVHPNPEVQGANWAGEQPFIDYILANRGAPEESRYVRYISPKTGEWKQVYFVTVPGQQWIICSSAWEHEMYAPIVAITRDVLAILLVSLTLTAVLIIRTSRRIGNTLGSLADALAAVGDGDLTQSVREDRWSRETALAAHH